MKRAGKVFAIAVLAAGFELAHVASASDEISIGTWKLNMAKSTRPAPLPKSYTNKIEIIGTKIKFTNDIVDAQGKETHSEWIGNYDGIDYPITGDPNRDTVARRRLDPFTVENVNKLHGKVTTTTRSVSSIDGRSKTERVTGINSRGQRVDYQEVWDRQ